MWVVYSSDDGDLIHAIRLVGCWVIGTRYLGVHTPKHGSTMKNNAKEECYRIARFVLRGHCCKFEWIVSFCW